MIAHGRIAAPSRDPIRRENAAITASQANGLGARLGRTTARGRRTATAQRVRTTVHRGRHGAIARRDHTTDHRGRRVAIVRLALGLRIRETGTRIETGTRTGTGTRI